jgi:chorismate synthase
VPIEINSIDVELRRRQGGYGRGGRQRIETDQVEILSGIWQNTTLGSPIALQVVNKDYKLERLGDLARPRPGHADLTGAIKYLGSIRAVLERASARETTVRVAVRRRSILYRRGRRGIAPHDPRLKRYLLAGYKSL